KYTRPSIRSYAPAVAKGLPSWISLREVTSTRTTRAAAVERRMQAISKASAARTKRKRMDKPPQGDTVYLIAFRRLARQKEGLEQCLRKCRAGYNIQEGTDDEKVFCLSALNLPGFNHGPGPGA